VEQTLGKWAANDNGVRVQKSKACHGKLLYGRFVIFAGGISAEGTGIGPLLGIGCKTKPLYYYKFWRDLSREYGRKEGEGEEGIPGSVMFTTTSERCDEVRYMTGFAVAFLPRVGRKGNGGRGPEGRGGRARRLN
jgi:hypothetical protein